MGGENLVLGPNGAGKTSLLEAVAVLATLRSFRTASLRSAVRHEERAFALEGTVLSGNTRYELRQRVEKGPPLHRELEVNRSPASSGDYLQVFPVVALSGADRELVCGAPGRRRSFLDRLVFLTTPLHLVELRAYLRNLRQRNAALAQGLRRAEIEVWNDGLAERAGGIVERRRRAVEALVPLFSEFASTLGGSAFPAVELGCREEPMIAAEGDASEVARVYRLGYNESWVRDRRTRHTTLGPHRHDLVLRVDGRPAREVLSSGQIRVVAAALRLAGLAELERLRGESIPVLVDDVDVDLDPETLGRLLGALSGGRQLFLASAHRGRLVRSLPGAAVLLIDDGRCETKQRQVGATA